MSKHSSKLLKKDPIVVWITGGLFFFLCAAVLGCLMRYIFVSEIPFLEYRHILHSHSHVALLGWGHMLLIGTLIHFLSPIEQQLQKTYIKLGVAVIFVTVGMLISFLIQGYALFSIAFSSLYLFLGYGLCYVFLFRSSMRQKLDPCAFRFVKWGFVWQVLSTLGLWALGPVMVIIGKSSPIYHASIQFFLHFQLNGWFVFLVLGLLTQYINHQEKRITISKSAFILLQISVVLTYFLSITWSTPLDLLFYTNSLGVLLQLVAMTYILNKLWRSIFRVKAAKNWKWLMLVFGLSCLAMKVLIQTVVVWPDIAVVSYTIHNFVIAFIHLLMIGGVTFSVAGILTQKTDLFDSRLSRSGWYFVFVGFILTELILFGQGVLFWLSLGFIPHYYLLLFGVTTFLPFGAFLLAMAQFRKLKNYKT